MNPVSIYNTATGVIRMAGRFADEANLLANIGDGEDFIEGEFNTAEVYIRDGQPFPYPAKPGPWASWNGLSWLDTRPAAEAAAEAAAALHEKRAAASLTRLEFSKVFSHPVTGVIQQSSGMALIDGEIPPELEPMIAAMPPADQFAFIMDMKGAMQFDRLNPDVIAAGRFFGLTDEQMDAAFGI